MKILTPSKYSLNPLPARQKTSDAFKDSAKQFLDRIELSESLFKNNTLKILSTLDSYDLPKKGEAQRIRTQTQLNLISIILKVIETHGSIDELMITTYTLNKEAMNVLKDLIQQGKIKKTWLFLASSYSFRSPEEYRNIIDTCIRLPETHLTFAWLHLKLTLMQCGKNYYHHESSMNYSTNNMAEQILFENDKEIYEFDKDFLLRTLMAKDTKALEIIC